MEAAELLLAEEAKDHDLTPEELEAVRAELRAAGLPEAASEGEKEYLAAINKKIWIELILSTIFDGGNGDSF